MKCHIQEIAMCNCVILLIQTENDPDKKKNESVILADADKNNRKIKENNIK